ncbi:TIGR04222 domain-containing membrane protein [Actinoallomurus sp. NPDC052274]|uniref:TIGR04222 domain-containing membrane protein n=1 Tax=Actinoallomurus sp. NPDC052274 TaxID=3155420 RepID=UPI0034483486
MTPDHDLSPYDVAYLLAGPDRVAVVALVGLHAAGRIRITADRHRVYAVSRDGEQNPVETAALDLIPDVGRVLGLTRALIAASPAVAEIGRRLRADGLLPGSRLSGLWRRDRARRVRSLRREPAEAPEGLMRVAVRGVAGIADDELRAVFETHVYTPPKHSPLTNPKRDRPVDLLQPDTRLNDAASGYSDGADMGGADGGGGW